MEPNDTRKLRDDLLDDCLCLVGEAAATFAKSAVAFAILYYVFELHYQQALEVAALLGAADFFARPRQMRTTTDLRERIQYTRIGRVVNVTDEREETTTKD